MFHQQNNLNNIPLHIPMPMHPINHFPNQIEELPPPSPLPDANQDTFTEVINISKIKDGFFIGDKLAAISIDVIIQFKITHFINATGSQIMNQWESVGINYLTLNWSENERQILFDGKDEIAERIVQFIDNSFIEGEGLLAHSFKGQNRVCIVVLIYLMKKYKWSLNKSLDYLKSKKNDVEIVPYFFIQLVKFEERLRQRGELSNDIPWPSTFLLKDKDEALICNTYMNGLPSEKENLAKNNMNNTNNNELVRHIIWNDENPSQKGPLEIVDREHDLFLEKDIRPVTSHQRIRPTKKCIKNSDKINNNNVMNMNINMMNNNNNLGNKFNVFNNNLNVDKNDFTMVNNFVENNANANINANINPNINANINSNINDNEDKNMRMIGNEKFNMPGINPINNNNQMNINNNNFNNMPAYNLGSLNSLNPNNMKNYGVIYDNNINNNKNINKNGINFNKKNNFTPNDFEPNKNQINTNTSINMKKNNSHMNNNNNNMNNKMKRSTSNKKSDKNNNLSNSSQNFIHNKLNNNNNIMAGKPLNNSMNEFGDKRNKLNNNENINNNMINNNFMNRAPLVEDIYGNNFDYIKHSNNTFLSNNNYNNRNINNNKINKAQYAINYNNNNIHNGYNNLIKNKPLNNFNPNLIKKKGTPQTGHTLLNRNKSNIEEGPVKIKKNNYMKNSNNNITNFNSNKKPTTPDLNHYSTTGFLSENNTGTNYNTNHSMSKTNSSTILGARGNSLQKSDKSSGIFGYGTKTNFKNKFSIKRPATAPHKDKVKVPSGTINKKNYVINGEKKSKIGKFNQRPQSAEGKNNKNNFKNYNTANNYNSNMNGIMGYNKNMSNSNVIGMMNNNKKYGINNIKNNLQNKRISSPINSNTNINNNKNLFNGSKFNNTKFRMPSPMIKPTNNIQRKNIIGTGVKIGKSNNLNFK